jgi:hypothetical protein
VPISPCCSSPFVPTGWFKSRNFSYFYDYYSVVTELLDTFLVNEERFRVPGAFGAAAATGGVGVGVANGGAATTDPAAAEQEALDVLRKVGPGSGLA